MIYSSLRLGVAEETLQPRRVDVNLLLLVGLAAITMAEKTVMILITYVTYVVLL